MTSALHPLATHVGHSRTHAHVVVETRKDGRDKLAFNPELGAFKLEGMLTEGHGFSHDFGFVPSTLAEDADPLDMLLVLHTPAFPGVVVEARFLGALAMEQHETDDIIQRKDRLLVVVANPRVHKDLHSIADLSRERLPEIEHFFHSYNEASGEVIVLRRVAPTQAQNSVTKTLHTY